MWKNCLIAFLISMVPLAEIRVGIPVALATGVHPVLAYAICIFGNMLPVPVIFFFARKVLEWGKDKNPDLGHYQQTAIYRQVLHILP